MLMFLGLSACGHDSQYQRPDLPFESKWLGEKKSGTDQAASLEAVKRLKWEHFFASPRLHKVIKSALAHNRRLRGALLKVKEARALHRVEEGELLPSLALGGQADRKRSSRAQSDNRRSKVASTYTMAAFTSYEVDLFGRLDSQSQAAFEDYLSTYWAKEAAQITLIAEVANAYLQWLADRESLALAKKAFHARGQTYYLVNKRYQTGVGTKIEVAQAKSLLETAKVKQAFFERRMKQSRNALILLMGQEDPTVFDPKLSLSKEGKTVALPSGLPSEVLLLRPDIREAEHGLKASNARISAARAAFFPSISLTGGYGFASSALGKLFSGLAFGAWSFVPTLTLPLFEGGNLEVQLDLSKIRKNKAVAAYEGALQNAFREVLDALEGAKTLNAQSKGSE
eukprot:g8568.t1